MMDSAKLLPRRQTHDLRPELTETAKVELRATARVAASPALRVRLDFAALSQLQLDLLPPDYYLG